MLWGRLSWRSSLLSDADAPFFRIFPHPGPVFAVNACLAPGSGNLALRLKENAVKTNLISLLLLAFLALSTAALASNAWYVNGVSGRDSNSCISSATACKTIGHAIAWLHRETPSE